MIDERDINQHMKWLKGIDAPQPSDACLDQTRARVASELTSVHVDDATRARIKRAVRNELGRSRHPWVALVPYLAAAAVIALIVTLGWSTPGRSDEPHIEVILAFDTSNDPELADIASELNAFENWHSTVDLMLMLDGDDILLDTLEPYYLTDDLEPSDDPV